MTVIIRSLLQGKAIIFIFLFGCAGSADLIRSEDLPLKELAASFRACSSVDKMNIELSTALDHGSETLERIFKNGDAKFIANNMDFISFLVVLGGDQAIGLVLDYLEDETHHLCDILICFFRGKRTYAELARMMRDEKRSRYAEMRMRQDEPSLAVAELVRVIENDSDADSDSINGALILLNHCMNIWIGENRLEFVEKTFSLLSHPKFTVRHCTLWFLLNKQGVRKKYSEEIRKSIRGDEQMLLEFEDLINSFESRK